MACCPSEAWGQLKNKDYKEKGVVEKAGDLDIYVVGQGSKCIIWNYDVFGFNGGRSRQMCDFVAQHGYLVLMPDFYRGEILDVEKEGMSGAPAFINKHTQWSNIKADWEQKIRPLAEKKGAKVFGAVGTCWGSYVVLKLSTFVDFKAGVSMHPSHSMIAPMLNESEEDLLKEAKCNQLMMPANGDHANVMPDGLAKKIMNDMLEIVYFPDMKHGWSIRGDMSLPEVERDIGKTFNLLTNFFHKYL